MSAELKQLLSNARGQQLRTQQLLNEIVMLASPIHHHKLAERQKKGACAWDRRRLWSCSAADASSVVFVLKSVGVSTLARF
jgi:hypothetical protein